MGRFIKLLEDSYKAHGDMGIESKKEYLANVIFDFDTDDSGIDELLSSKMLSVLRCILEKTTYEYIKNKDQYLDYILMINMPFLKEKLDSGISVRGSWFDNYSRYELNCDIMIESEELEIFIYDLLEWAKQ